MPFSRNWEVSGYYTACQIGHSDNKQFSLRTGKEIRFRFGSSEDKAGKEAKRRPTGWYSEFC